MVREIVEHRDAGHRPAQLEASPHAAEFPERLERRLFRHAGVAGGDEGRERILGIVPPEHAPGHRADPPLAVQQIELGVAALRLGHDPPVRAHALPRRETLDRSPAAHLQHLVEVGVRGVDDEPAVAGHRAQQEMELLLDRSHVGIDVRVVVLEVVQDRRARPVVDELRALVEEGGVVLVGLDHEVLALTEPGTRIEVLRHAADQEPRREPGVLEDEGQHARGGRLAVRARDAEHPASLQHVLRQPFRSRDVAAAAVEQRLDQRVAAAHHVADHEHVRCELQLVRLVALDQVDAERLELRAHRRIHVAVGAGDPMAGRAGQRGDAAHERSGDADDVQVHAQPTAPRSMLISTSTARK